MERKQCLELFTGYFLLGLQDTNVYFNINQQTFIFIFEKYLVKVKYIPVVITNDNQLKKIFKAIQLFFFFNNLLV